ncbi:MAG: hypothetical protein QXX20_03790 [Candidatus Thermoplasmatota archaeon]
MPGFEYGFKRAFIEIIIGLIIAITIQAILHSFKMDALVILFDVFSILAIIFLIDKMTFWSLSYLIGWLFGFVVFSFVLTWWEIILYVVVTFFALFIKIKNRF